MTSYKDGVILNLIKLLTAVLQNFKYDSGSLKVDARGKSWIQFQEWDLWNDNPVSMKAMVPVEWQVDLQSR